MVTIVYIATNQMLQEINQELINVLFERNKTIFSITNNNKL